jgi:hypothetical protein
VNESICRIEILLREKFRIGEAIREQGQTTCPDRLKNSYAKNSCLAVEITIVPIFNRLAYSCTVSA